VGWLLWGFGVFLGWREIGVVGLGTFGRQRRGDGVGIGGSG
jgi:hypothetical protein